MMDLLDSSELMNKLPRNININRNKVYVTWKAAPHFCTFCKMSRHKKPACKNFVNANLVPRNNKPSKEISSQKLSPTQNDSSTLLMDSQILEPKTTNLSRTTN
jgi:hypothetical protein